MKTIQKKCQVVLLPTDKPHPQLFIHQGLGCKEQKISSGQGMQHHIEMMKVGVSKPQHLYILSDEEIKEGDWYLDNIPNYYSIEQAISDWVITKDHKKIIATTNPELEIKVEGEFKTFYSGNFKAKGYKHLPKPTDKFIQDWIENGCPEIVNAEYIKSFEVISEGKIGFPEDTISWWKEILKISSDNTITCSFIEDDYSDYEAYCEMIKELSCGQTKWITPMSFEEWLKETIKK